MTSEPRRPRFAYEDPATLAWSAHMVRVALDRRRRRLAAERAEHDRDGAGDRDGGDRDGGGNDAA